MPQADQCRFTKDHEWVFAEGDVVVVGITDFAQQELGDIVYVNVPDAGAEVSEGAQMGEIESVKAVAEVYAPVAGKIVEANPGLADHPEVINSDPMGEGWLVKVQVADPAALDKLMDYEAYRQFLSDEGH